MRILEILSSHKTGILTGLGIGSMLAGTILGIKYSPMAHQAISKKEEELGKELTVMDKIKTGGPYLIPSGIFTTIGVGSLVAANTISVNRETAAMAAYTLLSESAKEYREKVKEIVGEKKEKTIREEIAKDTLSMNPMANKEIIITGGGNTLCFEKISGRYFRSDIEKLRKIENELNRRMMDTTFISLNELYYQIGLNPVTLGDELGWDIGRGLIEMQFSAQLADNGEPCLVVDFAVSPHQF